MNRTDRAARGAIFSADRVYRHLLWRDDVRPLLGGPAVEKRHRAVFVACNPSVGDELTNDRTLGRFESFAAREGCGSYEVVNTHDLVSTNPDALRTHPAPISSENDAHILWALRGAKVVIAAWGKNRRAAQRGPHMRSLAREAGVCALYCLGTSGSGSPNHPLYLPGDTPLVLWAQL